MMGKAPPVASDAAPRKSAGGLVNERAKSAIKSLRRLASPRTDCPGRSFASSGIGSAIRDLNPSGEERFTRTPRCLSDRSRVDHRG
jgi:hypothetical protein